MLGFPISGNTNLVEKALFSMQKRIVTNASKKAETRLTYLLNEHQPTAKATRRKVTEVVNKTAENALYESNAVARSQSLKNSMKVSINRFTIKCMKNSPRIKPITEDWSNEDPAR